MAKQVNSDQHLEGLFSDYFFKQPDFKCQGSYLIARMCVNSDCKNTSLVCNNLDCQKCGPNHPSCTQIVLSCITNKLNLRALRQKEFISQMYKSDRETLKEIKKSTQNLTAQYTMGDLEEKYIKIVTEVYKKKNANYLMGKDTKQFYQRLEQSYMGADERSALLLQHYKTSVRKLTSEMVDLKNTIFETFVKAMELSQENMAAMDSVILKKPLMINLEEFKSYRSLMVRHSKYLSDELASEQISFLRQILNNPKQIQLLYRGSDNGFSASNFHQKCDNIPNTLVIVRTEFGKTIGGFTQYAWNAASNNYFSQTAKNSFLFSLDLKEKYVPVGMANLIYCNTGYGPTFGGHDLFIANQCNLNNSSSTNFPKNYNKEGQNQYVNNQESYKAFCGATSGNGFRVMQYEVFRVNY